MLLRVLPFATLLLSLPAHAALISSWNLDETAGNISDSLGASPAGIPTGVPDYAQPGVPTGTYGSIIVATAGGTSIGFGPGTVDEFFTLGTTNSNPVNNVDRTGTFTVMAWINPSAADSGGRTYRALSTGSGAGADGGWGFGLRLPGTDGTSAAIRFTTYNVADNDSATFNVTLGQWVHIASVYSNGVINYYLNGNLLGGGDNSFFNNDTAAARLTIGSRFGGSDFDQANARLDGVQFYNEALSAGQIQAAAALSVAVPEPAAFSFTALGLAGLIRRRRK